MKYFFIISVLFLASCSSEYVEEQELPGVYDPIKNEEVEAQTKDSLTLKNTEMPDEVTISAIEQQLIDAGLVDIQSIDSTIRVDVKYATTDNFMGRVIYADFHKVYLQPKVAERLGKAQKTLQDIDSTLTLLVFDGARPRSVQQEMWDAMDTIPFHERIKFLSNPANGSIHNYGCAVDLTIMNKETGEWLDMGAGYDDLKKIAYPRHEAKFLGLGELSKEQVKNRKLLRQVMKGGGFWVIQTEWWHFNAYTRDKAKELYEIIE